MRAYELQYFRNGLNRVNLSSVFNPFVVYDTSIQTEPIADVHYLLEENKHDVDFSRKLSGIAIKYKLLAFKQYAGVCQHQLNKSLVKRYMLFDINLQSIDFHYCENLPFDDVDLLGKLTRCSINIFQESMLKLAFFIKNPAKEIEHLKVQKGEKIDDLMAAGGLLDA